MNTPPSSRRSFNSSEDNWSGVTQQAISTGSWSVRSRQTADYLPSPNSSVVFMQSLPSPQPLSTTSGRMTPPWRVCSYPLYNLLITGTRFQLGEPAIKRNCKRDWQSIWDNAKSGRLDDIDPGTRVCHYRTIKQIAVDHMAPLAVEREVHVFWGATGTGKSRRAWDEAGWDAYPKDPRSKFWDGYSGQSNVVIDEFRGDIDVAHLLRWFDRYPVIVEVKGSSVVFKATKIWITSNISPDAWFPLLDEQTKAALRRRLRVTHFNEAL